VTVRPIVLKVRPTGKSSKKKPSPTVSILSLPALEALQPSDDTVAGGLLLP
jgi:hypothetical protein